MTSQRGKQSFHEPQVWIRGGQVDFAAESGKKRLVNNKSEAESEVNLGEIENTCAILIMAPICS